MRKSRNDSMHFDGDDYNKTEEEAKNTLKDFLCKISSGYIGVVPQYWLEKEEPSSGVQTYMSILFLMVCIPGNVSQLLVMIAYSR